MSDTKDISVKTDAYSLAAQVVYKPEDEVDEFIESLKRTPVPLTNLLEMERTAKARGNIALGEALHGIFESGNPGAEFVKLGVIDNWGDEIFIEAGSVSEKSWLFAQEKLASEYEREAFAKALGFFVSVEIDDGVEAEALRHFINEVPENYRQGLPMPPHMRLTAGEGGENTYDHYEDTVSINSWEDKFGKEGVFTHEIAHFFMDIMDDKDGPNTTFYVPKKYDGGLLFDPARCAVDESVSIYGGVCDEARGSKGRKKEEDPVETITYVVQKRMGKEYKSWDRFSRETAQKTVADLKKTISEALKKGVHDAGLIDKVAEGAFFISASGFPLPPEYKGDDRAYLEKMSRWLDGVEKKILPAQRVLGSKIAWAKRVLDKARTQGYQGGPNPDLAPWNAAADPYAFKPANEPLIVNSGKGHYMVVGKSREEGERDLRALTATSKLEEAWLFVEAEDGSGKIIPIWFEIGIDETLHGVNSDPAMLSGAVSYVRELGFKPLNASHYHIHPVRSAKDPMWVNFISHGDYSDFGVRDLCNLPDLFKKENQNAFDKRVVTPKGIWKLAKKEPCANGNFAAIEDTTYKYFIYLARVLTRPKSFLSHIPILSIFEYLAPRDIFKPEEVIKLLETDLIHVEFQPF